VEEFEVLSNEAATDTDEKNLMYLPTSVREMLLPEFDLRSQNTVFTQVSFDQINEISI
jgi:hypothetical protein